MSPSHMLREGEDMSTDAFFKFPTMIRRLHAGPLRVHMDEYVALLQEQGYSRQLAKTTALNGKQARFRPPDELLRFLNDL